MALIIKNKDILGLTMPGGVIKKCLLNRSQTGDQRLEIFKYTFPKSADTFINMDANMLGWLHPLTRGLSYQSSELSINSLVILPPENQIEISCHGPGEMLICCVPNVDRFLKSAEVLPSKIKILDWSVEPVLLSEFDSRRRVYLASPGLWDGIECVKGEMIYYPKGGTAPMHHHEHAEHFQYVMEGQGIAYIDGQERLVEKGDIIYNFEFERHWFENRETEEFSFAEFFIPGDYKTIWAKDVNVCTWLPTGKDIKGRDAVRHIAKHIAGEGQNI